MPMHDWTRVEAGIFHDFHLAWTVELRNALNGGLLPQGYYALTEQHAGQRIPDLIARHGAAPEAESASLRAPLGGLALAEAPPRVSHQSEMVPAPRSRRRTLAIRHVSGHRLVAVVEIVSPANKDRLEHIEELAGKIDSFLGAGIHAMMIDPFPVGLHDPNGLDAVIREFYCGPEGVGAPSIDSPPCVVSYCAALRIGIFSEPLEVGRELPVMPLFYVFRGW